MSELDAVILVGGLGTRLRPLTLSAPKPMLPTAGVPFLAHLVRRLEQAGITHVVLGTSYQAEVFEKYFGDGAGFGVELEYVVEAEALGTGGGIRNVADRLRADTVLVFNGDNLIGADLRKFAIAHQESGADVSLCLHRVPDPRAYGCVPTDADGRVTAFLEKDPNPVTDQINAGLYAFRRSVIDSIPAGQVVSVERDTFPELLRAGAVVRGRVDDGYWRDFGTPADFVDGSADLVQGIAPSPAVPNPGEFLIRSGTIADSADVRGGSALGDGCAVGADAVVEKSVLFDGARVEAGAVVRASIIGAGAVVGAGAVLDGVVLGDRVTVAAGARLADGARVWPDSTVPGGDVRYPGEF